MEHCPICDTVMIYSKWLGSDSDWIYCPKPILDNANINWYNKTHYRTKVKNLYNLEFSTAIIKIDKVGDIYEAFFSDKEIIFAKLDFNRYEVLATIPATNVITIDDALSKDFNILDFIQNFNILR